MICIFVTIKNGVQCVLLCTLEEMVDCFPLDLKNTATPLRQIQGSQKFLITFWKKITSSCLWKI